MTSSWKIVFGKPRFPTKQRGWCGLCVLGALVVPAVASAAAAVVVL